MKNIYRYVVGIQCIIASALSAQTVDPKITEIYEPVPHVVTPGKGTTDAPSDAIVLFDGKNLDKWHGKENKPASWKVEDGAVTVEKGKGAIWSKQAFGNFQLHLEWRAPKKVKGEGQGRGNSGVFLQDRYEIQILDNYKNPTYSNGQAGSVYKQHIPLANACKKPGEWQTYDIIFMAPVFGNNSDKIIMPATVTVLHNGVLVQNNVKIWGPTTFRGLPIYERHDKAPIRLQDHGDAVSFRNIWIREL